jgi:hypothetical protein
MVNSPNVVNKHQNIFIREMLFQKVMMSTIANLPSVVKPRFIEPVGQRTKLPKVDAR